MSSVSDTVSDTVEVIKEGAKGIIGSAQTKEKKLSMYKVYLPIVLFIGALCSAFYALVVGSGTVALGAIGAFVLCLFLIYYFVSSFIKSLSKEG